MAKPRKSIPHHGPKVKPNGVLASYEAMLEARYRDKLDVAMQLGLDAGMIAANDVLKMGPGRAEAFRTAYITSVNEMAKMLAVDGEDDPDLVYSREVIDRRIKAIVGEDKFAPWDERYKIRR